MISNVGEAGSDEVKVGLTIVVFPKKKSTNKNNSPTIARIILLINFSNKGDFFVPVQRYNTITVNYGSGCVPLYPAQILLQ
ncbi:MAG: hypothetical protein ACRDE5_06685, partial [Ginsengibacter sp.]